MFCPYCGAFTEYGEKVSRHEVLPPSQAWGRNTPAGADPAINPDGTTSTEAVQMSTILTYGGILIGMAVLSLATGMLSGRFAAFDYAEARTPGGLLRRLLR